MSKAYDLIVESLESSVRYGYNRAHKHNDSPSEEEIIQAIVTSLEGDLWELVYGLCFQIAEEKRIAMMRGDE